MNDSPIVMVREFPVSPERVFDAWLEPAALAAFLCPAPGVVVEDVHVDAKLGGSFSLVMRIGETRIPIRGAYCRLDRASHLSFSWLSHRTNEDSVVALEFVALQAERTRLTLSHCGFPDAASRADHDGGWANILASLSDLLAAAVPAA